MAPLDQEALIRILGEPKNALVKQYQKFFELEDVELEFTDDALEAVADQALLRGTGARGLRAILEEVLLNVMYDLPSRTDVQKCVIDRQVVLEKVNPTLVPARRGAAPAAPAPRGVLNLAGRAGAGCDQHIDLETNTAVAGQVEGLKLDNMRELCARARRPAGPAADGPHHRHERQGLGRPHGHRAARRPRPHRSAPTRARTSSAINERISRNGEPISDDDAGRGAHRPRRHRAAARRTGRPTSSC